jgi:hypothetical protein
VCHAGQAAAPLQQGSPQLWLRLAECSIELAEVQQQEAQQARLLRGARSAQQGRELPGQAQLLHAERCLQAALHVISEELGVTAAAAAAEPATGALQVACAGPCQAHGAATFQITEEHAGVWARLSRAPAVHAGHWADLAARCKAQRRDGLLQMRASALQHAAYVALMLGDFAAAERHAQELLEVWHISYALLTILACMPPLSGSI